MTAINISSILAAAESRFRGPGGAVAVLKDGSLIGQRVWGYADLDRQIPLTADTIMPICSISKQFFCALLLDLQRNPPSSVGSKDDIGAILHDKLKELLGAEVVEKNGLTIEELVNMQSGLRDYWACCVPWGAHPDSRFGITEHSALALENTRSLHFEPGTQYSYCNTNWHIIGRILEQVLGLSSLGDLLKEKIFEPAGMKTARLIPDCSKIPEPCVGYEGSETSGYMPATNRIEWSGDAGIMATLTDMIAYEKYIDKASREEKSIYHFQAKAQNFKDGNLAPYHYGLIDLDMEGVRAVGHGGALRGFRLQRFHVPEHRVSVMVMFNHEAAPSPAAEFILRKILNLPEKKREVVEPAEDWKGNYLDEATGMVVAVKAGGKGEVAISFAGYADIVKATDATNASSDDVVAKLDGDKLQVNRLRDNLKLSAKRLPPHSSETTDSDSGSDSSSLIGQFHCADIDSTLHVSGLGQSDLLYASFKGFLGKGPAHLMRPVSKDVWLMACPRSPDAPAPGDWTVLFDRDGSGKVKGAKLGCWLARGLVYTKS